ncbi:MAG: ThuA domain-containing protein [Verrucomicrobiota bacterium]
MKNHSCRWRTRLFFLFVVTMAFTFAKAGYAVNTAIIPVSRTNANWVTRHESMNQQARERKIDLIYVGDSIVQHFDNQGKEVWQQYYAGRNALNLGISGDRTEHVLWRLDHGNIDGLSPKLAIVMIGQNNGGYNTGEEIADGFIAIVQKIRAKLPNTKILLLGIFQRREKPTPERAVLAKANAITSKLADGKIIFYMDINPIYVQPDGSIPRSLMYDFEHPTPLGHRVWAEAIEPKVAELMGDTSIVPVLSLQGSDSKPVRVLVWDEQQPEQKQAYGDKFLGETITAYLGAQHGITVKTVNLASPEQGLDEATLDSTDVIVWWGHIRHPAVTDAQAERVVARVKDGRLGLIALHSAHWSKPFVHLMQDRAKSDALAHVPAAERATAKWEYLNEKTIFQAPKRDDPLTPSLTHEGEVWRLALPLCVFPAYRPDGAPSHVTTLLPLHPIAAGLPAKWDVAQTEMYDEPFHVPPPDAVVFEERWDKGEHFRSGCVWQVGKGRVFYFRPGHEVYPVYKQAEPLRVIENAVRWLGTKVK